MEVLTSSVTVTAADWLMTTSSPAAGAAPLLQLVPVVHFPLVELTQDTVLGSTRSCSVSRRGLTVLILALCLCIRDILSPGTKYHAVNSSTSRTFRNGRRGLRERLAHLNKRCNESQGKSVEFAITPHVHAFGVYSLE